MFGKKRAPRAEPHSAEPAELGPVEQFMRPRLITHETKAFDLDEYTDERLADWKD